MFPIRDDNPTRRTPYVTIGIIFTCILVFLWELSLIGRSEELITAFSFVPASLFGGPPSNQIPLIPSTLTIITSMFLHGGLMHLLGNMLYLWIFGNNVEDAMGHGRFIVFYLLTGIIASLAHALPDPTSTIPTLGASGAISGVLGAYLLLYPKARVQVLVTLGFFIKLIFLPAGLVLGFWFILQVLTSALGGLSSEGVAWGAHIGGFIAGMILIPLFKRSDMRLFNPVKSRY